MHFPNAHSLINRPDWWIARPGRFICGLLVGLGKLNFNDRSKYFTFKTVTNSSFTNPVPIKCWPWKSYHILLWPGRELSKISENGIKCHHASASLNPFNIKELFLDFLHESICFIFFHKNRETYIRGTLTL